MSTLLAHLRGRWSAVPPTVAGVYFQRSVSDPSHSFVAFWSPEPFAPFGKPSGDRVQLEFAYMEGDVDGSPSRADDPHVIEQARSNGWKPVKESRSRA